MKTYNNKLVSYAQNNEDIMLWGYFHGLSEPGFYVDLGANHPVDDSVTHFFYERGWSGVNVEPNKELSQKIKENRPRDINLNIGIADKNGTASFRQYSAHGLSSFSEYHKQGYADADNDGTRAFKDVKTTVRTLKNVLKKHAKETIHFLKIDIEGFEHQALSSNDWNTFRPWVICIESPPGSDKKWQTLLKKASYLPHMYDGLNEYYVAAEQKKLMDTYHVFTASGSVHISSVSGQQSFAHRARNKLSRFAKPTKKLR